MLRSVLLAFVIAAVGCDAPQQMAICIQGGHLLIDDTSLAMPADIRVLEQCLGKPNRIAKSANLTDIFVWDELGIYSDRPDDNGFVGEIVLTFNRPRNNHYCPKKIFAGNVLGPDFVFRGPYGASSDLFAKYGFVPDMSGVFQGRERKFGSIRCFTTPCGDPPTAFELSICDSVGRRF